MTPALHFCITLLLYAGVLLSWNVGYVQLGWPRFLLGALLLGVLRAMP